ncbi:zinc-binding dehydrogenase [Streptomyces sp. ISL-12]|uniref:quinone oxidoreductase family protein n=1 Tax=Streptomyces sp. ISL-12 TaxID=2819177 RepID=UPI001BE9D6FB|nr:zinc-binding dehydrogenase [Streptomyces sp. ISL-12]MBT2413954.1 zinc-binding dehydrogenase [Streptomyces sp. ISL-12]
MRAVRFHAYGSPDVLRVDEVPVPQPGPGQVLVRVTAAGVGFADVQIRAGLMRQTALPDLPMPFSPGFEVAGTVAAAGPGVDPTTVGRRVVGAPAGGGYAELALVSADAALPCPDALDDHTALALLGQGTTAVGVTRAAALHAGDTVLVEAAAGGVGSLLVQLARRAGATVIGAARGEKKLAAAEQLGAHIVIDYTAPDWHEQARDAAGGSVQVVLETTGGPVSAAAFDLLTPGTGRMVIYGTASGQAPRFDPLAVYHRGVSVTGFASMALAPDQQARLRDEAFGLAAVGELEPVIGTVLPLSQAAAAHRAFEERATIGKTVLTP